LPFFTFFGLFFLAVIPKHVEYIQIDTSIILSKGDICYQRKTDLHVSS
jgi:hypothetical protein